MLLKICLNPCFNGRYSQSQRLHSNEQRGEVLILVLMEDTLRVLVGVRTTEDGRS